MNSHLDTAIRLHARGFVVMPARRGGKIPLATRWQDTPMPSVPDLYSTWDVPEDQRPNVSVLTGERSGIFVLDIDPGAGGADTMTALVAQHGNLPDTYVVQTGSGGWHYYFQMPAWDLRNSAGKVGPGIDIRANGGQVIAPPSFSEKGTYREVAPDAPITEAPAWLLEVLAPKPTAATPVAAAPAASPEQASAYERAIIDREVARLDALARPWHEGAGWDQTTFEVACTLTQVANSSWAGLSHNDVERIVLEHAPQDAAWGAGEVLAKITSARSRVGSKDRPAPVAATDVLLAGIAATEPQALDTGRPWTKFSWDDFGNANRIITLHGDTLRWQPDLERWAVYRDGRWEDSKQGGERCAIDTIERLRTLERHLYSTVIPPATGKGEPKSEQDRFDAWVHDQRYHAKVVAATRSVKATGILDAPAKAFDTHPMLLNVRNCVVDLLAGSAREHDPALLLKQQAPVTFDPAATAPTWQAFLDRTMPSKEMQGYLQRIIGYSITGSNEEHAFFLHHGETGSGKSVFLSIMEALLGEYAQTVPSATLLSKRMEQHPADIARMEGKRMLQLSELDQGARLDEALIKRLSGGDTITARGMGQEFREFKMTGKAHVVTNFLPHIHHDPATQRRLHLIHWAVQIPASEQDPTLKDRIIATELPGILNWAIAGAQAWKRDRLQAPVEALMDRDAYVASEDEFGDWLAERTQPNPTGITMTDVLYRAYAAWAEGGNLKPMNVNTFGKELARRGIEAHRTKAGRGWRLALVQPSYHP